MALRVENNPVELGTYDLYSYVDGMSFGEWIRARREFIVGNLIESVPYVVESILRDVVLTEHDLIVSAVSGKNIQFNGTDNSLLYSFDDYYNGSYLVNIDQVWTEKIVNYIGNDKEAEIENVQTVSVGDRCYFSNIRGDELIDTDSIDLIAESGGLREDWKVKLSINQQTDINDLIDNLLIETRCAMTKSVDKYRIIALDSGDAVGLLDRPRKENGDKLVDTDLTSIDDIYTSFEINYGYRPHTRKYAKTIKVDKNNASVSGLDDRKIKCKNAEINYRVTKHKIVDLNYVEDDATAVLYAKNIIDYFTYQKLVVGYIGDMKQHLQYEKGDIVRFNVRGKIPYIKNGWARFMITSIDIPMLNGGCEVVIKAEEVFQDPEHSLIDRDGKLMVDRDGNLLYARFIDNVGEVLTDRGGKPLRDASGNFVHAREQ